MRVLMVVPNASLKMGGESGKNIELFRRLPKKGVSLWMVCHARCREELRQEFSEDEYFSRIFFVDDDWIMKFLWYLGQFMPYRIQDLVIGSLINFITQLKTKKLVQEIIEREKIQLLFQPTPLSAKAVSLMYNLNIPVVMGPLCGNVDFPQAFRSLDRLTTQVTVSFARQASLILHKLFPGKVKAETIIFADQLALSALPPGHKGKKIQMLEPAVDTLSWQFKDYSNVKTEDTIVFVYIGRLVDWKGVKYLINAFKPVAQQINARLDIIGDGELRQELEELTITMGIEDKVKFHGWLTHAQCINRLQQSDVFVMPSLRESGGHAILEAMASALPVIACDWGGPALTVSADCGFLIKPSSKKEFIRGLSHAMFYLAESPEIRKSMGYQGYQRVRNDFLNWDSKCDRFIEIFEETLKDYYSA